MIPNLINIQKLRTTFVVFLCLFIFFFNGVVSASLRIESNSLPRDGKFDGKDITTSICEKYRGEILDKDQFKSYKAAESALSRSGISIDFLEPVCERAVRYEEHFCGYCIDNVVNPIDFNLENAEAFAKDDPSALTCQMYRLCADNKVRLGGRCDKYHVYVSDGCKEEGKNSKKVTQCDPRKGLELKSDAVKDLKRSNDRRIRLDQSSSFCRNTSQRFKNIFGANDGSESSSIVDDIDCDQIKPSCREPVQKLGKESCNFFDDSVCYEPYDGKIAGKLDGIGGCIPCEEKEDLNFEEPSLVDGELKGIWMGDCSDFGYHERLGGDADIFPTRTGCFIPEEYFVQRFEIKEQAFGKKPELVDGVRIKREFIPRERKKWIPREDILNLHQECQYAIEMDNAGRAILVDSQDTVCSGLFDDVIQCRRKSVCDYIDEDQNFIRGYYRNLDQYTYQKPVLTTEELEEGKDERSCIAYEKTPFLIPPASGGCEAFKDSSPYPTANSVGGISPNIQSERYLPPSLVNSQGERLLAPPYSKRYQGTDDYNNPVDLGEYGFSTNGIDYRIERTDHPFDKYDVYGLVNEGKTIEEIKKYADDPKCMGTKLKRQQALRLFLEEYAQQSECNGIRGVVMLDSTLYGEGHCQYMVQTNYVDEPGDVSGFSTLMFGAFGGIRPTEMGMISEHYNMINFQEMGWPFVDPNVGILGVSGDICERRIAEGGSQVFNDGEFLDFSKRDCGSYFPSDDRWPEFFRGNLDSCDHMLGYKAIGDDKKKLLVAGIKASLLALDKASSTASASSSGGVAGGAGGVSIIDSIGISTGNSFFDSVIEKVFSGENIQTALVDSAFGPGKLVDTSNLPLSTQLLVNSSLEAIKTGKFELDMLLFATIAIEDLGGLPDSLTKIGEDIGDEVQSIADIFNKIGDSIANINKELNDVLGGIGDGIGGKFGDLIGGALTGIKNSIFQAAIDNVKKLPGLGTIAGVYRDIKSYEKLNAENAKKIEALLRESGKPTIVLKEGGEATVILEEGEEIITGNNGQKGEPTLVADLTITSEINNTFSIKTLEETLGKVSELSKDFSQLIQSKVSEFSSSIGVDAIMMTTDIRDIRSLFWQPFTTVGFLGVGLVPLPAHLVMPDFNLDDGGFVDTAWTASTCTIMPIAEDVMKQTPDWAPIGIGKDLAMIGSFIPGFKEHINEATIYNHYVNWFSMQGGLWCEFQLPFDPFSKGVGGRLSKKYNPFTLNRPKKGEIMSLGKSSESDPGLSGGFYRVERIRDGCGAFSQRGSWRYDEKVALGAWLTGKKEGRCDNWRGAFGKKYENPKMTSWRLARFDYEFLKTFIECTGPVRDIGPNPCGGVDIGQLLFNACLRCPGELACTTENHYPCKSKIGLGFLVNTLRDDATRPKQEFWKGEKEDFGFWCNCPDDKFITSMCNENACTCEQLNVPSSLSKPKDKATVTALEVLSLKIPQLLANTGPLCENLGPYKRWLQCYHLARARSCPVVTRDISNSVVTGDLLFSPPEEPEEKSEQESESNAYCEGVSPPPPPQFNVRWEMEEPNFLARLNVEDDPAAYDKKTGKYLKHSDFICISQTKDGACAPSIEPSLPSPRGFIEDIESVDVSNALYNKNARIAVSASETWADDQKSTYEMPNRRALEAITGARGCDIGGWYEMMLYQSRCIQNFGLSCMCDYDKTFINGSAEKYVLKKSGARYNFVNTLANGEVARDTIVWPLMWRGYAGADYASGAKEGSKLWDKSNLIEQGAQPVHYRDYDYNGLSEAEEGDIIIWDHTIVDMEFDLNSIGDEPGQTPLADASGRYLPHVSYVESVGSDTINGKKYPYVEVSEMNWGKYLDSCGNTDRWNYVTSRKIYKHAYFDYGDLSELGGTDNLPLIDLYKMPCDNPDYAVCYEHNWNRVKVYRPTLDYDTQRRPVCGQDLPSVIKEKGFSKGYYPFDVVSFVEERSGRCDPPITERKNTTTQTVNVSNRMLPPVVQHCAGVDDYQGEGCPREITPLTTVIASPKWALPSPPFIDDLKDIVREICRRTPYLNLCKEALDCIDGGENCDAIDCVTGVMDGDEDASKACRALCNKDIELPGMENACSAFYCAESIRECNNDEDCDIAEIDVEQCCRFPGIIDSEECCNVKDLYGDIIECTKNPGPECCEIFPESSSQCKEILGCAGIDDFTNINLNFDRDKCCNLFPGGNSICGLYECAQDPDTECCNDLQNVTREIGIKLPSEFDELLSSCQKIEQCVVSFEEIEEEDVYGPVYRSVDDLKYTSKIKEIGQECCGAVDTFGNVIGGNIPFLNDGRMCQISDCIGKWQETGETPYECCSLIPGLGNCEQLVQCVENPSMDCCNTFSDLIGENSPVSLGGLGTQIKKMCTCAEDIMNGNLSESCCRVVPDEIASSFMCKEIMQCSDEIKRFEQENSSVEVHRREAKRARKGNKSKSRSGSELQNNSGENDLKVGEKIDTFAEENSSYFACCDRIIQNTGLNDVIPGCSPYIGEDTLSGLSSPDPIESFSLSDLFAGGLGATATPDTTLKFSIGEVAEIPIKEYYENALNIIAPGAEIIRDSNGNIAKIATDIVNLLISDYRGDEANRRRFSPQDQIKPCSSPSRNN